MTPSPDPSPPPDLEVLLAQKELLGQRISVCLPALNEAETVGDICRSITRDCVETGMVDELVVVVDDRSIDDTEDVARRTGASVVSSGDLVPEVPRLSGGKGDILWRSLAATTGEILVWIDADLTGFDSLYVPRLVTPLLEDPEIVFVKGHYARNVDGAAGGGRVTELVARPLLNLFYPELAGLIQPLSGEMAGRREALTSIPFFTGYGVEIGVLIDLMDRFGKDSIAQVDLIARHHRSRDLPALGLAAHQIMQVVLRRVESDGRAKFLDEPTARFIRFDADRRKVEELNLVEELPPFDSLRGASSHS
jgi:glucosyl-3-phosphoglycerate synthase